MTDWLDLGLGLKKMRVLGNKSVLSFSLFPGVLLGRNLPVTGDNDKVASKPVGDELMALEGKAGPTFIWLVKVDTLISSNNELQVLRRVAQG